MINNATRSVRSLAIDNLPASAAGLSNGSVYAVVHDEDVPILAVIWPTLLAGCQAGPVQWVTERDPDKELASSATADAGRMRQALESGRVLSFLWGGGSAPLPVLQRILAELDYFGSAKGGLVVLDGADRLFDSTDPKAADEAVVACHRWAERNDCALLLLCSRRAGHADPVETFRVVAHRLGGFARFRRADHGSGWDVFHWFGPEGVLAGRSLRLSSRADGCLAMVEDKAPQRTFDVAADEDAVFITRAALPSEQPPPAAWHVAESFDALGTAAAAATAATIVLHYDPATSLDTLARTVFGLRQSRGSRIKIVVREVNVRMRYSQEQLIVRLGANLVVAAEVVFSRFLGLIDMVQGQVFSRPLAADYEAAVMAVAEVSERGYLAPPAFAEAVVAIMKRAHVLNIQSALIRLPLVRGLSPADALRYCSVRRAGDLCTADADSVYVFLFACRESDIGFTLDRLFRLPVAELFEGEERCLSSATIHHALEHLAEAAAAVHSPDLGAAFSAGSAPAELAAQAVPSTGPARAGVRRAPAPAVRRPLPLRQVHARGVSP